MRQLRLQLAEIASIAVVLLRQAQEEARDAKTLAQVTKHIEFASVFVLLY